MRVVHTFFYNGNKSFKAWELTVWLYYLFLRDSESALEKVLSEFNTELPKLTKYQLERFLDILFKSTDPVEKILNKHNIKFAKNMKEVNVVKRALDNWWKTTSVSPEVSIKDLSVLDDPDDEEEDPLEWLND